MILFRFYLNRYLRWAKKSTRDRKICSCGKTCFSALVNEIVNSKISSALSADSEEDAEENVNVEEEIPVSKIVTTEEEIEGFYIIRGLFGQVSFL